MRVEKILCVNLHVDFIFHIGLLLQILSDWTKISCHLLLERSNYIHTRPWTSGNRSRLQGEVILLDIHASSFLCQEVLTILFEFASYFSESLLNVLLCTLLNSELPLQISWPKEMAQRMPRLLAMSVFIHQQKYTQPRRSSPVNVFLSYVSLQNFIRPFHLSPKLSIFPIDI